MNMLDDRLKKVGIFSLFLIAGYLRYLSLPAMNIDLRIYNIPWYETILRLGIFRALGMNFSNYTPPYTYLLALSTLAHPILAPIVSIKLIPTVFDLLTAVFIYKIVKLNYPIGQLPLLASAIYFIAPTVIINSAYWGQTDSIYTSFLVISVYYLLLGRPISALTAYGISLSIKAQAIFLFPLLVVLVLRKRIPIWTVSLIPFIYLLAILPAALFGRSLGDALFIYITQAGTFHRLSRMAPNLYSFMPESWYSPGWIIGMALTLLVLVVWIRWTSRSQSTPDKRWIVQLALISVALTPFLLPKMHDRYFYPADVLSIILVFYWPSLWFIPIAYQTISFLAYTNFFSDATLPTIYMAAILNTITLAYLLKEQLNLENPIRAPKIMSSGLSWITGLLMPVLLFGLILRLLFTLTFLKYEYNRPNFPPDEYGFTTTERITWAPFIFNYLYNKKEIKFLNKVRMEDGRQVFNDQERLRMIRAKDISQKSLDVWYLTLLCLPLFGITAWICNGLAHYLAGITTGGWICVGVGILILFPVLFVFPSFLEFVSHILYGWQAIYLSPEDTFSRLFPLQFWKDIFLILSMFMIISGFILAAGANKLFQIIGQRHNLEEI